MFQKPDKPNKPNKPDQGAKECRMGRKQKYSQKGT